MSKINVIKRDGSVQPFNKSKVINAIKKAVNAVYPDDNFDNVILDMVNSIDFWNGIKIEEIQDAVIETLRDYDFDEVADAYAAYRSVHSEYRMIKDKVKYISDYANSNENAAANSNTDANANNACKNVSSVEIEVFKDKNRLIQRMFMKDKLKKMFPELESQYEEDLNNHIIYTHDEGSSPIPKAYCGAYVTYPLMTEGVGNTDSVTPGPPNDLQSFSGQITNLVFALSAQSKGAVALGDGLVALNYYIIKEFGEKWYEKLDKVIATSDVLNFQKYTIRREIKKAMKQFIYGVNQPQGNRGFQSPFTNFSIYDKYYYNSLFDGFMYPDGTIPTWQQVDTVQRIFIALMRELRMIKPLTFPVLTVALLYDENGFKDKEYAELCAEEWAKGSSHFLYNSGNAESLSSCCRVQNKLTENYFTSTTGMIGLMTGSCNVITLNMNRIIQDWFKQIKIESEKDADKDNIPTEQRTDENLKLFTRIKLATKVREFGTCAVWENFKDYLIKILERVYKYHIAYKTMLYELEDQNMITYSNAGYLYIKKLYSTIGVIGYYEAAKFLGLEDNSDEYKEFINFLMKTISDANSEHSIYDKKRPFIFNLEAIPGENLAVKLYNWDKKDNYYVPEDQNLYNCYFFNPWKYNVSVFDKLDLHGKEICKSLGGGQAAHINLDSHLSKEQYLKIMEYGRKVGCNYYTFNIPMSECKKCGHVVNGPVKECPICHSKEMSYWTRVIGFLTSVDNWSPERQKEFNKRVFGKL